MEFVDTHCHLHEAVRKMTPVFDKWHEKGEVVPDEILASARQVGVTKVISIGTTLSDSELAIEFAVDHDNVWASVGIHPHEAHGHLALNYQTEFESLLKRPRVVAIGETGLDYFYDHSPRADQIKMLEFELAMAEKYNLPMSFHVRAALDDFWPIFDNFKNIRGVLHSYTDSLENIEQAAARGLYFGVNGIATFSKKPEIYRAMPPDKILLETDAPFLTPTPYRGTINEPKHVRTVAEFLAKLRGENLADLAKTTTDNAHQLFGV